MDILEGPRKYIVSRTLVSIPALVAARMVEKEGRLESRFIFFFFWELRLLNNMNRSHQNNFYRYF